MQPTPLRLSQTIWTAFRAAKPVHQRSFLHSTQSSRRSLPSSPGCQIWQARFKNAARFYSDDKKSQNIEEKVQDAKERINDTLESRAETATAAGDTLNKANDETIVHTIPESASIVYSKDDHKPTQPPHNARTPPSDPPPSDLPSQIKALRSKANERFAHFMDNLQSHIFVASKRINDLTGYSGIERLKREIEAQESFLQETRQLVRDNRSKYTDAIANRSATQREVNDLLHRKHAWSPSDLERFTGLYRSDHANEQAEQAAHQELSDAEAQYEEASTKLAKSILARYHEEQIWSDKIRQMSTWGTWGLMGLNILLFIVLQLAIEPWRRRRLVRGFEQKVAEALASQEQREIPIPAKEGNQVVAEAAEKQPESVVSMASEGIAEAIVDAVTGSTSESVDSTESTTVNDLESAAEQVVDQELVDEAKTLASTTESEETITEIVSPNIMSESQVEELSEAISQATSESTTPPPSPTPDHPTSKPFAGTSAWSHLPASLHVLLNQTYATVSQTYAQYSQLLLDQFKETDHVVLSRRELTTRVLEGVAAGAALTGGIMLIVVRLSWR